MIEISNINKSEPYSKFIFFLNKAIENNQAPIDAICISSYDAETGEVDSRYVNLKFILNEEWIFFSNYMSPKAKQFISHKQISSTIFWPSINVQIRTKAVIKKTSIQYNQKYFFDRSEEKNALAISSNQSKSIDSFTQVKEKYNHTFKNSDLRKCPEYWGGFSFTPYEIEFWEGSEFRLNKRNLYKKVNNTWKHFILEP